MEDGNLLHRVREEGTACLITVMTQGIEGKKEIVVSQVLVLVISGT